MSSTEKNNNAAGNHASRDSSSSTNPEPLFIVKKIEIVALWSWKRDVQNCGICKFAVEELCLNCQALPEGEKEENCPRSVGPCKHVFHAHCINKWTSRNPSCPLCNKRWPRAPNPNGASSAAEADTDEE